MSLLLHSLRGFCKSTSSSSSSRSTVTPGKNLRKNFNRNIIIRTFASGSGGGGNDSFFSGLTINADNVGGSRGGGGSSSISHNQNNNSSNSMSSSSSHSSHGSGQHVMSTRRLRKLSFLCGNPKAQNPFNLRFAPTRRPFFPIISKNLREEGKRKKKGPTRGQGKKGRRGTHQIHYRHGDHRPDLRMWEGSGNTPLYKKIPRWKELKKARSNCRLAQLSLARLRYFIEKGRLDTRYPITQRHLFESGCCKKVWRGVKLFNYNDYPFPYKIDIEAASCDQSSIDMIRRVNGSVTIVHYGRISLKAHLKPYKFDILPQDARPNMPRVQFLEKMRARGCLVRYIRPLWLLREEERVKTELRETVACDDLIEETRKGGMGRVEA